MLAGYTFKAMQMLPPTITPSLYPFILRIEKLGTDLGNSTEFYYRNSESEYLAKNTKLQLKLA